MGKQDEVLRRYFADNERYADLINGFVLHGCQVVHAKDLSEMDSRINGDRTMEKQSGYRDLIRHAAFGADFAIIGMEQQSYVDYLMPVRCMEYDVMEYGRQASERKKQLKNKKNLTSDEFLSAFRKGDRLNPCITFVLYYGEKWDGSTELHDLLNLSGIPEKLRCLVNNYRIHLLDVRRFEKTDVFKTDLKQVFDFIRYSKDKQKLKELSEKDPTYLELDEEAYDVAVLFTNAKELLSVKKKEGGSMCQALKELLADEREEGREEGESRLALLIQKLLGDGRNEDIYRVTTDKAYLDKLYLEFQL